MLRSFNRGGNWNNGANAGVFNSNGNNPRSNANGNIGFRSASSLALQSVEVRCRMLKGIRPER